MFPIIKLLLVLIILELKRGNYLLLELDDSKTTLKSSDNFSETSEIESRAPYQHLKCWRCIVDECKKKDQPSLDALEKKCAKYFDYNKYRTTKELVECATTSCRKAVNEIEFECRDGGMGGIAHGGPCFYEE